MNRPYRRHPARPGAPALALIFASVLAACGGSDTEPATGPGAPTPPAATYTVGVTVNAVGSGETFQFALGSQSIAVTQGGQSVRFGTALAAGAAYTVSQSAGPRTCTLSANRTGTIAANVEVTADCGTPPTASGSRLGGEFRGPVGASVTLSTGAGNSALATIGAGMGDQYNAVAFELPALLADGSAYTLALSGAPAGQTCRVYKGATGTMPAAAGTVKAGCEWTFQHVARSTSTSGSARGTFFDSTHPAIGGDATYGEGRFVAFVSSANLNGANPAGHRQVWWHDTLTGETYLVSSDGAGNAGNGNSAAPAISADGLTVVFESSATNLVAGDSNGVRDVFVWSSAGGTIATSVTRASVAPGGAQANGESHDPQVSADGRVIVFASYATNLVGQTVTGTNAYRRDTASGATTLVSLGTNGQGVGGAKPAVSADGNRVAFWSFAANIAAGDTNGLWDIFVYDHAGGTRQRVSLTSTGGERNQGSESASRIVAPAISGDGRFVAYATTASNVVPGDTNGHQDVFVVEVATGAVQRASVAGNGAEGNADSPIGQGERPAISHDGTWVAFSTTATNLGVATTTTGIGNVLMRNRAAGATRAVTDQRASGSVDVPTISKNGTYVAFGASTAHDPRVAGSGLFVHFTDLARAWFWID